MPEVHIIGELAGASQFERPNLYCKWKVVAGVAAKTSHENVVETKLTAGAQKAREGESDGGGGGGGGDGGASGRGASARSSSPSVDELVEASDAPRSARLQARPGGVHCGDPYRQERALAA